MRLRLGLLLCLYGMLAAAPAYAWGAKGHRLIGELAVRNLPPSVPSFLRTQDAAREIGELAREPDRSRGAGLPHDPDRDPAHFLDLSDDGMVLEGPSLALLPENREAYDSALRAASATQYKAGWLPYAIMDGFEQLVKDFALWRADVAGEKFAKSKADRHWFAFDRVLREKIAVRDLGVWAHFVGDGSQPLHVTVHFNGWGDFPNPEGFTPAPNFHSRFESDFVDANIGERDVAPLVAPLQTCHCSIRAHTISYLSTTHGYVLAAFRLDQAHGFDMASPEAKSFAAHRLAEAASMLRDMVADAWDASGDAMLGYKPLVALKAIEAGRVDPKPLLEN